MAGHINPAGPAFEAAGPDFAAAGPDFEAAWPNFEAAGPDVGFENLWCPALAHPDEEILFGIGAWIFWR